jgi:chromosome segregation ATPase
MNQYSPDPSSPSPSAPSEIEEDFETKQARLQAELAKLTKGNVGKTKAAGVVEAAKRQSEQVSSAFEKGYPKLKAGETEAKDYLEQKMPMVVAAVGANKGAIDKVIADEKDELKKRAGEIGKLKKAREDAQSAYESALEELKAAQEEFDGAKTGSAQVAAAIAEFQSLIPKIEGEDPSHPANMYFLAKEAEETRKRIQVSAPEEFRGGLEEKLDALTSAITAAQEAQEKLDNAAIDFELNNKPFLAWQKGRRERILKKIAQYNKPAPASAPAAPAATP